MKLSEEEFRRRLAAVPTCTAIDVLQDPKSASYIARGVAPIQHADRPIAGRARTLRYLPWRDDFAAKGNAKLNIELIDTVREGEVLVFDTSANLSASVLGDILALRAVRQGAAAVVTDGVVRDLAGLEQTALPVFAAGVNPMPYRGRLFPHAIDNPVQCGGALVCPGDWILADRDAVLVLPEAAAVIVVERASQAAGEEVFTKHLLEMGATLSHSFPVTGPLRSYYESFVANGSLPSLEQLAVAADRR